MVVPVVTTDKIGRESMGAWGYKSFENDDALDWVYELEGSDNLASIEAALDEAGAEYIEAPEACNILAAAELVVALLGKPRLELPADVSEWLSNNKSLDASYLKVKTVNAVQAVLSEQSELNELWQDSEEYQAWRDDVEALRAAVEKG